MSPQNIETSPASQAPANHALTDKPRLCVNESLCALSDDWQTCPNGGSAPKGERPACQWVDPIEVLRHYSSDLPTARVDFAENLVAYQDAFGKLSDKQLFWRDRLYKSILGKRRKDRQAKAESGQTPVFLYVIADHRCRVKIGFSARPHSRLANLQTSNPAPLALCRQVRFASRHEARMAERAAHEACASWRKSGEWFSHEALYWFDREYEGRLTAM